jgi:hypothetical protein
MDWKKKIGDDKMKKILMILFIVLASMSVTVKGADYVKNENIIEINFKGVDE